VHQSLRQSKKQDLKSEQVFFDQATPLLKGEMGWYLDVNYQTIWQLSGLAQVKPGSITVFEAGCGSGAYGIRLARLGYAVTGVDISPAMIAYARHLARQFHVKYRTQVGDLLKIGSNPQKYDIVLCPGVLHHFPDLQGVLNSLAKRCKKNGRLVLVEPNGSHPVLFLSERIRRSIWPFSSMKSLASPNETNHRVSAYLRCLAHAGFSGFKAGFFEPVADHWALPYPWVIRLLIVIKFWLVAAACYFLPKRYSKSVVVIQATKLF
jgi:SAM-dependent methyltransferase